MIAQPVQPGLVPDPSVTPLPGGPGLTPAAPLIPGAAPWMEPAVDVVVDVSEAQTGRFMIGAGINSDAGVVGQVLLDERNFDWRRPPTSWNDFATGTAWRGAGQRFRIEAAPGTQVQRYLISFQEPYLWDTPISLGLSGSYFDRRFRDWDEQRVGGRVSLGYQWVEHDLSSTVSYRGELINIHDPAVPLGVVPELDEVLGENELHGFRLGIANDTRDSAFFPTEGHYIELAVEQVVGDFEYPRATVDINEYALVRERPDHSGRHIISGGTRLGFTGSDTPIYDNFYAGGYSSLRGFDFRGASPVKSGVEVGGEFMWLNTVEYLFPLTADDMIHGVVFVDWGTVEEDITLDWEKVRVSPGVGLRLTIPAMGPAPIALDFAWAAKRVSTDDLQVFSFNVGFTR
jgi:outer membrane protein insertion porin family